MLSIREKINKTKLTFSIAEENLDKEKINLKEAKRKEKAAQIALKIVQDVAMEIQSKAYLFIQDIVNRCLESTLDDPYEFKLKFEQKRGKTEARLVFIREGVEIDPMQASGGGVVDIASFALRLACLILHRPALPRVLILDEPFKFVSADIRDRIAVLLTELSKEIRIQIIMVTHLPELEIGKVCQVY